MMKHLVAVCLALMLCSVTPAHAAVIYSQTFDGFTVGDECTELLAGDATLTGCRYDSDFVTAPDISYLQVASSVPGSSASLPSGNRILKSRVYTATVQGDVELAIGDSSSAAYNGYIPADVWFQVALYINNTGSEVTNITANRPMKFWYPCTNGAYPCQSGGSYNYFLLQTIKNTSGAPFCDTSLNSVTDGSMYLFLRDNDPTNSSPAWAGNGPVCGLPDNYLGQTSLTEYIRPGRWNIIKVHANFTSASGANFEAWIAPLGGSFTKVMNWISGTTIEGYNFTWTYSAGDGSHRAVALLTSHPVNVSTGVDSYMYLDDYYVATSEADLPVYSAGTTTTIGASGGARFNGVLRLQ